MNTALDGGEEETVSLSQSDVASRVKCARKLSGMRSGFVTADRTSINDIETKPRAKRITCILPCC
jgi:hypothetical protein